LETGKPLLKILVCDDDSEDRKLVQAYLRRVNDREIVLLEAGQSTEIQNALDTGRIDLILMDIQMPEKSGLEWLAQIVEKQTAPVVMLTGFGNEEVAVQCIQEGAVGYLPKSRLSTDKLVAAIDDAILQWQQLQRDRANQTELRRLATIDPLTGLQNRRAILAKLREQIKCTWRNREELSLLMLDIDHFKKVNDRYGHITGDDALEKVAVLMLHNIRDTDIAGRYGGEEFLIILPKTDLPSGLRVGERLRSVIEATEMKAPWGNVFGITVSQGLSGYMPGDDVYSLIARTDNALYRAKQKGRNRVEATV
jgi:two-component system cell cycle response regulator